MKRKFEDPTEIESKTNDNSSIVVKMIQKIEFPEKLITHCERLIVFGLENWIGEVQLKESIAKSLVEILKLEYQLINDTNHSNIRKNLNKKIELIVKSLKYKSDNLETFHLLENYEQLLTNYLQQHEKNIVMYESIVEHHENIKHMNWIENVTNDETLEIYASSAELMGSKDWMIAGTEWMKNISLNFYYNKLGIKYYNKIIKTLQNNSKSNNNNDNNNNCNDSYRQNPMTCLKATDEKIKLLDIGSCFNPFKEFNEFEVTAVDLCPSNDSVHKCDFLDIIVTENIDLTLNINNSYKNGFMKYFPINSFDVCVMSLVLSYLPCPKQRLLMIKNARKTLIYENNKMGLLLIYEKCSILHNNYYYTLFLKHWKQQICLLGFELLKYERVIINSHKSHAFSFVTTNIQSTNTNTIETNENALVNEENGLWIKQDFKNKEEMDLFCEKINQK